MSNKTKLRGFMVDKKLVYAVRDLRSSNNDPDFLRCPAPAASPSHLYHIGYVPSEARKSPDPRIQHSNSTHKHSINVVPHAFRRARTQPSQRGLCS